MYAFFFSLLSTSAQKVPDPHLLRQGHDDAEPEDGGRGHRRDRVVVDPASASSDDVAGGCCKKKLKYD